MKKPGNLTLGVVSVLVAAGAVVASGPAVSAAPQVQSFSAAKGDIPPVELIGPNGEKPVEWGVATFVEGSGALTKESVGGGTWHHGTRADGGYKQCYSNYIYPDKKHSASVAIGDLTDKDIQAADVWAKASRTTGWAYKCSTYWGVY
ncbi:lactococcin 972 family bacteriocin [Streptomyces sp. NBC_00091]|uniref:lactococcin 972 family bacteriocin n=1 Tax=Streptomyces sp. NBC_00091 TaxID=2975648 RepID=UPI00224FC6B1|nr:lactococcin 972 family bacteriocin [Streptomyces sp. NBC_00091]MCX5374937.1 lactococcin 972 family bacteriocin [Streptomyces sp. NBC_00091]MCX5380230.1 lactococcin 972 family bacteriocin [Streptomyces sp. NBC_00091]